MSDFVFNGTFAKNIRLKWMAMCLNLDYDNQTVELYLNGEKSIQTVKKPITLPVDYEDKPLVIRFQINKPSLCSGSCNDKQTTLKHF